MLIDFYNFEHALHLLGNDSIHFYDIPSLVLIAIAVVMGLVHWRRHKKRQEDMEKELEEKLEEKRAAAQRGEYRDYDYAAPSGGEETGSL